MNANQNRQLLVRQLRAVCNAVNRDGVRLLLDVGSGSLADGGGAMMRVTIDGVVTCKFYRYGAANYDFINECRECVCAALAACGLTAGLDALRVTA